MADEAGDQLATVWPQAVTTLTTTLTKQHGAWLSMASPVGLLGNTALLSAPTDYAKDAIERHLRDPITATLSEHACRCRSRWRSPWWPIPRSTAPTPAQRLVRPPPGRTRTTPAGDADDEDDGGRPRCPVAVWPTYTGRREPPESVADQAQREVQLRHVRHRGVQPVRPRGRRRGRRGAGGGLQPVVHLGRFRSGQDPPAARDRALCPAAVPRRPGALRLQRGIHQRLHQLAARRPQGRVPAALPRRRRAAGGRHPVPGGQGRHPGGVLPHVQHPAQRQQADRHLLRPPAQTAGDARGADADPVRVGPDHRHPAAGTGDADRHPAQEGRAGRHGCAGRRAGVHRQPDRAQHPRAGGRADPGRPRSPRSTGSRWIWRWPRWCCAT